MSRRGISTLWLLIALPTLLVMFCFVVNIANLWLARVELENALESAALAAVLEWGENGGGATSDARDSGVAYALANRVRGVNLVIDPNLDPMPGGGNPNENLTCTLNKQPAEGNLIFGAITNTAPTTFESSSAAGCGVGDDPYAVRAQAIVNVRMLCGPFFLFAADSYCVTAKVTAVYDCSTGQARLIRVRNADFICP